jgi:uncharacterized membrane protein YkvA (DUF1232 family)
VFPSPPKSSIESENAVKVSFELSPKDIRYFREQLKAVRDSDASRDEATVIQMARELVEEANAAEPPEFVLIRLVKLEQLIAMLEDDEWRLEGRDRARILDALAYFVDPDDMIPDKLPGIGYLDDAIMVELVTEELKHDIKAYEDFCEFRKGHRKDDESAKLDRRRSDLQSRMRRRRRRDRETVRGSTGNKRSPLRLW